MSSLLNAPRASQWARRSRRAAMPWSGWRPRLQARMQPMLAQVQSRWRGLSRRERSQVAAMVVVVVLAVAWLLLTKPALDTLSYWDNELPRLRSQAAALKDVLADVGGAAAPGDSSLGPAERARASLDAAGLAGAYQVSGGGATLQIEFERSTDVSRVMAWLLSAPALLEMTVQQVTLQRSDDSGPSAQKNQVRAKVTLAARRQQAGDGS